MNKEFFSMKSELIYSCSDFLLGSLEHDCWFLITEELPYPQEYQNLKSQKLAQHKEQQVCAFHMLHKQEGTCFSMTSGNRRVVRHQTDPVSQHAVLQQASGALSLLVHWSGLVSSWAVFSLGGGGSGVPKKCHVAKRAGNRNPCLAVLHNAVLEEY